MDILLTFTGFHDPYSKGLVDQEEQPGPILSLLNVRIFGHVFLFETPTTRQISRNTKEAINALHPKCKVRVVDVKLSDPTSYRDIFSGLKHHVQDIQEKHGPANFFISVASGIEITQISSYLSELTHFFYQDSNITASGHSSPKDHS